jgi:hypothetical protein
MKRFKSSLACSYCSKIFKDPIELPCSHNLCKEHLAEKDVAKQNRIKCGECKKDFEVKDNDFKTNNFVKKQIDELVYLSDEEFSLKKQLQDSIRQSFQMYEQFTLNKTIVDLDVHEHFQEIRFKLDEHREELKVKIDDIYMEMIEKTKKFEATYLKSLADKLEASLKSFETTSLEQNLKETEESFRNPNLLTESIRDMQRQQEDALAELKLKLDEQSQAKDILINMNEFKPKSITQDSFGQLYLNEYSIVDLFMSQILSGRQPFDLIKLCEFNASDKWTLLYRGTRDGFEAKDFHLKCDKKSPTLTIIKAKDSGFIFGGYTEAEWDSSGGFRKDPNTFLFSLTNTEAKPCKKNVIDPTRAIFCDLNHGPIFGGDEDNIDCDDLSIANNANTNEASYSCLGNNFKHPEYEYSKTEVRYFLSESEHFRLNEIEVYIKS